MPVLESTDHAIQRSVLRHRPIVSDTDRQGKTGITPVAQRASRLRSPETEEDEESTSGRIPATPHPKKPRMIPTGTKHRGIRRVHPLLYLGIGMIVMLALWTLLTLAVSWWNMTWNDMHYGRPRTFQIDAVVGQNDSAANPSHFIAMNFKGRIEVIEFPGVLTIVQKSRVEEHSKPRSSTKWEFVFSLFAAFLLLPGICPWLEQKVGRGI